MANLPDPEARQLSQELEAARFLARSSAELAQVADYETTLDRIANLAVPGFADWFGVHVRESDGRVRRIAVRHRDPLMQAHVVEMYRRYPPSAGTPYGALAVMATGQAIFAPRFAPLIDAAARDEGHASMLRQLGLRSFICVPMRSHGVVVGALTLATAESGRDYEELHLRAAEDLAARAAIAIENAQLLEALREADRRKDEFLAILAHELRNPLAPLRNAIEILASKPSVAQADWLQMVLRRQVGQLTRLVDDLLDVSRITNGKIELRRGRMAIDAAVEAAVEASGPAMDRARHELVVEIAEPRLEVEGDVVRLSQVLGNLLNNAAKYTPDGGLIRLSAAREGSEVVVRVRDTGLGIPQAMLDRVFDMFVQVPGASAPQGGLGIGLTLVRRLVELHGGSVQAFSEGEGRGSEFVVRLPGAAPLAAPVPQPEPVAGDALARDALTE